MIRLCTIPLVALALSLAAPASGDSGTVDREFHESFPVQAGDRLVLRHEDGDVRVTPWDRDELDVEVVYHAEYSEGGLGVSSERDFVVEFRRSANEIRVSGRQLGGGGIRLGWSSLKVFEHLYIVRAPSWLELELRGEDGDVELSDWSAATDIRLDDGDLVVERFSGTLEVVSRDGDVTVRDSRLEGSRFDLEDGDVEMNDVEGGFRLVTDDGDVIARTLAPHAVYVQTQDGDLHLDIAAASGTFALEVRTSDGDAELVLRHGVSARFDVTTDDGRVDLALPDAVDVIESRTQASGRLGAGDGRIVVHGRDGVVSLRARE